jgi:hypothetical protein
LRIPKIQYQSRFIDDGVILVDDEETAQDIAQRLNDKCNLKFTHVVSKPRATYMDITIYKGSRYELHRKLDTKVFFKPTNKLLYLPTIRPSPRQPQGWSDQRRDHQMFEEYFGQSTIAYGNDLYL